MKIPVPKCIANARSQMTLNACGFQSVATVSVEEESERVKAARSKAARTLKRTFKNISPHNKFTLEKAIADDGPAKTLEAHLVDGYLEVEEGGAIKRELIADLKRVFSDTHSENNMPDEVDPEEEVPERCMKGIDALLDDTLGDRAKKPLELYLADTDEMNSFTFFSVVWAVNQLKADGTQEQVDLLTTFAKTIKRLGLHTQFPQVYLLVRGCLDTAHTWSFNKNKRKKKCPVQWYNSHKEGASLLVGGNDIVSLLDGTADMSKAGERVADIVLSSELGRAMMKGLVRQCVSGVIRKVCEATMERFKSEYEYITQADLGDMREEIADAPGFAKNDKVTAGKRTVSYVYEGAEMVTVVQSVLEEIDDVMLTHLLRWAEKSGLKPMKVTECAGGIGTLEEEVPRIEEAVWKPWQEVRDHIDKAFAAMGDEETSLTVLQSLIEGAATAGKSRTYKLELGWLNCFFHGDLGMDLLKDFVMGLAPTMHKGKNFKKSYELWKSVAQGEYRRYMTEAMSVFATTISRIFHAMSEWRAPEDAKRLFKSSEWFVEFGDRLGYFARVKAYDVAKSQDKILVHAGCLTMMLQWAVQSKEKGDKIDPVHVEYPKMLRWLLKADEDKLLTELLAYQAESTMGASLGQIVLAEGSGKPSNVAEQLALAAQASKKPRKTKANAKAEDPADAPPAKRRASEALFNFRKKPAA